MVKFGEVDTPVIGLRDLLKNKLASGRPKDLLDAEVLEKLERGRR